MIDYNTLKEYYTKNNKLDIFNEYIEKEINYILNQTDYTRDIALDKLKEFKMDKEKIIMEYMGIDINIKNNNRKLTTNEELFNQFRIFLDNASENYYKEKELKDYINNQIIIDSSINNLNDISNN